jgi:hypothetical protein
MSEPRAFKDRAGWRRWLEKHHATVDELWLAISKKHAADRGA